MLMKLVNQIKPKLNRIVGLITQTHVMTHAAAVSYRLFVALPPMLMLLISLIRYLPFTQADVMRVFSDAMPPAVYSMIDAIVSSIYNSSGTATALSAVLLLLSASASMRAAMKGLNEIYSANRERSFARFVTRSVVYMLVFVLMLLLSLIVLVYGKQIVDYLGVEYPESTIVRLLLAIGSWIRYLVIGVFLILIFMLFYQRLPSGKRRYRDQFAGALFSAGAWLVFSWGFSLYVSVSDRFGAYGFLGTFMIVLIWMYYCLLFFLIGGCVNVSRRTAKAPAHIRIDAVAAESAESPE